MPQTYADIALLTEHRYAASEAPQGDWYLGNILRDDRLLQEALEELGLSSVRVDWARPDVDWSQFRAVVFRTTWDYYYRFEEFSDWLKKVEQQTKLINDDSIIWWNLDKHYLADLEEKGIPVVASRFLETGAPMDLKALLRETGWEEAVIKPCISGGARYTYRVTRENAGRVESLIRPVLEQESFMVQPFIEEIVDTGEDTLMVLNGTYTHAVRKVAKPGDFRVQDDHGGTYQLYTPTAGQIDLAERVMEVVEPIPEYARVDMVRDNDGRWSIMELELIEPELWLREHPPAAKYLAQAIARIVSK